MSMIEENIKIGQGQLDTKKMIFIQRSFIYNLVFVASFIAYHQFLKKLLRNNFLYENFSSNEHLLKPIKTNQKINSIKKFVLSYHFLHRLFTHTHARAHTHTHTQVHIYKKADAQTHTRTHTRKITQTNTQTRTQTHWVPMIHPFRWNLCMY